MENAAQPKRSATKHEKRLGAVGTAPMSESDDTGLTSSAAHERLTTSEAQLDVHHVFITTIDKKTVLRGYVKSRAEKKQVERAVWASPEVLEVENRLRIRRR